MENIENQYSLDCIILELEQLKIYIKELEERLKKYESRIPDEH